MISHHTSRFALRALLAAATLAVVAPGAGAQTAGRYVVPRERAEVTGSVSAQSPGTFQFQNVAKGGQAIAEPLLQRFPLDARQMRFETETSWREFPVYVRPAQADAPVKLKIRYISSVAVMPEASRISVLINDQSVLETNIEASNEPASHEVALPAGLLEAGYNGVRVLVSQRHRVDCTIEAVNELWTQVDVASSGLIFSTANDQVQRIDDIVSIPPDADSAVPIIVHLGAGADAAAIDRTVRAAQALAIRLGITTPKVSFTRAASTASGLHLAVGTTAELRSRGIEVNDFGDTSVTVRGRLSGAVHVSVSGATLADVDDAIARLGETRRGEGESGTQAGLRALTTMRGFPLGSEGSITLKQAGVGSQEFNGRLFRTTFNIVLPSDFYPADNGKAALLLSSSYAPGLLNTNEVIIRVNGKVVGARRLKKSYGESMRERAIELSLRSLQPGFNAITLEIRAETETDRDCNPLSLLEGSNRVIVSDQTRFVMPQFARANHLPNMGATASMGFPMAGQRGQVALYLPRAELTTLGAATTLLVRTAISAGHPIEAKLSLSPPDASVRQALVVGPAADIPAELMTQFGLPRNALPASWLRKPAAGRSEANSKERTSQPATTAPPAVPRVASLDSKAGAPAAPVLPAPITDLASQETVLQAAMRSLARFLQRNVGYSADQLDFLYGDRPTFSVSRSSRVLLAQAAAPAGGGATWHLLTAPDAATLQKATDALVMPSSWTQLAGRAVALDPSEAHVNIWQTNVSYYYDIDDWSLSNVTLFAAGWLSNNIQYYVLVILSVCGIFGVVTRLVLNRIGSRP